MPFKEFSIRVHLLPLKQPIVWPLLEEVKIKCHVPYKKRAPSNVISEGAIVISTQYILPIPLVSNQADVVHKRKKRYGSKVVTTSTPFMETLKTTKQPKKLPKQKKKNTQEAIVFRQ